MTRKVKRKLKVKSFKPVRRKKIKKADVTIVGDFAGSFGGTDNSNDTLSI